MFTDQKKPIFLLNATLMIPNVSVKPTLEEIQEVLVLAGKHIVGLSKGITQWSGGKTSRVPKMHICTYTIRINDSKFIHNEDYFSERIIKVRL